MKARIAPPDPVPVYDPRPENYLQSQINPYPASGNFIAQEQPAQPSRTSIETEGGSPMEIE